MFCLYDLKLLLFISMSYHLSVHFFFNVPLLSWHVTVLPISSLARVGKQLPWLPKMSQPSQPNPCAAAWVLVVYSGASLPSEQRTLALSWETGTGAKARFFFQQDGNCQNLRLAQRPFPSVKWRERFNIFGML